MGAGRRAAYELIGVRWTETRPVCTLRNGRSSIWERTTPLVHAQLAADSTLVTDYHCRWSSLQPDDNWLDQSATSSAVPQRGRL